MKQIITFLLLVFTFTSTVFSSTTGKIRGTVIDAVTGEPLIGVNISLKGTNLGAATNINGVFIILRVPPGV